MDIVDNIAADRLVGVVQTWLWEFEEPRNWPTPQNARDMVDRLRRRRDASSREVGQAVKECKQYIAAGWI
jgi:hypothetical protein